MAKSTGLGQNLYIGGVDLSGDIGSVDTASGSVATIDATGIDKSAYERILGLRDGSLTYTAYFNDAGAHLTLRNLPTTDVHAMYVHATTIGAPAACMVGKQLDYGGTRGTDGALTFSVPNAASGYALEWCDMLTAGKRTDTTATNGSAYDYGAGIGATSFGLSAYLQVFAFSGTSVTVAVQDSADGASGWASVATFTAVTTAPGFERIGTTNSATIKRYLRVITTGTFSNAVFAVAVAKHVALSPLL